MKTLYATFRLIFDEFTQQQIAVIDFYETMPNCADMCVDVSFLPRKDYPHDTDGILVTAERAEIMSLDSVDDVNGDDLFFGWEDIYCEYVEYYNGGDEEEKEYDIS